MKVNENIDILIPEFLLVLVIGLISIPLMIAIFALSVFSFIQRRYYLNKENWDLNICCGGTDGGGVNADCIKRNVPNFVLIQNIYKLPFENKQFNNVYCSHTIEHLDDPDRFMTELKRISKKVTIIIPPLWDLFGMLMFRGHKWQFLTLTAKHNNEIPTRIKLTPFWWIQDIFGQSYGS
jgi:SAM-dependent methyltransferase